MAASRRSTVFVSCSALAVSFIAACSGDGATGPQTVPVATVVMSLATSQVEAGKTVQATAVTRDANGNTLTGRTISWSTSSSTTATVDANGLVTGVAPGIVDVVATSEGKSASAPLTVVPDPVTQTDVKILGIRQDGAAVDLGNVTGPIEVDVEQSVPDGFVGTFELRMDTALITRVTYPAAGVLAEEVVIGAPNQRVARAGGVFRKVEVIKTHEVGVSVDNDMLNALPTYRNGVHDIVATLNGTVAGTPINKSATEQATTNNPSGALIGLYRVNQPRTLLIDGKQFVSGSSVDFVVGQVDYNTIPAALIERVEVVTGGASAVYGAEAVAGVVNFLTRRTELTADEWQAETTSDLGSIFQARTIEFTGGGTRNAFTTPPIVNGWTPDMNKDGWFDETNAPSGFSIPGATRQLVLSGFTPPAGWNSMGGAPRFFDFKAPVPKDRAFFFFGSDFTSGQQLQLENGVALPRGSVLAPTTDLRRFIDLNEVTDGGVGMHTTTPYELYTGGLTGDLYTPANKWSFGISLSLSANYDRRAGAVFQDRIGNLSQRYLFTSAFNPFGWSGFPTSEFEPAAFRVVDNAGATFSNLGVHDRSWSRTNNFNFQYCFTSNGDIGTGNFMTGYVTRNEVCAHGFGSICSHVVLPFQRSGALAIWPFNTMRSQAGGLTWEGYWEAFFRGYSLNGNPFTTVDSRVRIVADATPPLIPVANNPVSSPLLPNVALPVTMTASDNVHVSRVGVIAQYDFSSSVFENNEVEFAFNSGFWNIHQERWPTWSGTYDVFLPTRFTLASGGNVSSNPAQYHVLKSISAVSYDAVGHRSPRLTFPVLAQYVPEDFEPLVGLTIGTNISGTINLCQEHVQGAVPCPQGSVKEYTITGTATSPTANYASNAIDEMRAFLISIQTRRLVLACATREFTETQINGSTRASFDCEIDVDRLKIDPGSYLLATAFTSRLRGLGAKDDDFHSVIVFRGLQAQ